jgi:hypothetical protein
MRSVASGSYTKVSTGERGEWEGTRAESEGELCVKKDRQIAGERQKSRV